MSEKPYNTPKRAIHTAREAGHIVAVSNGTATVDTGEDVLLFSENGIKLQSGEAIEIDAAMDIINKTPDE